MFVFLILILLSRDLNDLDLDLDVDLAQDFDVTGGLRLLFTGQAFETAYIRT